MFEIETIQFRLLNDTTLDNLAQSLWNHDFNNLVDNDDVDVALERLEETIMLYYNIHCPIVTKVISKKDREKPWINSFIKKLIKNRENYYKSFKKNRVTPEFYKHYRNFVSRKIIEAKKAYLSNLLSDVKRNMKKTWNFLNGLIKPGKKRNHTYIKQLLINNIYIDDDSAICNALNQHFASVGSNISESFGNAGQYNPTFNQASNSFFFRPCSPDDVTDIIRKMKNKASHVNTYPTKVLKHIAELIAPFIANIINESLSTGYFPSKFKTARVIPLHKGGSKEDLNNYRPISLLPLLCKVFEKVVYNQLYFYLERFNLLNPSQFGFRRNKSTVQAVMDHLEFVYNHLDEGDTVISIFMDFKKAFDCLDHDIILKKL